MSSNPASAAALGEHISEVPSRIEPANSGDEVERRAVRLTPETVPRGSSRESGLLVIEHDGPRSACPGERTAHEQAAALTLERLGRLEHRDEAEPGRSAHDGDARGRPSWATHYEANRRARRRRTGRRAQDGLDKLALEQVNACVEPVSLAL